MTLPAPVEAVLCDADGNLFPSEEPAFDASADVTNAFLASLGVDRRYTADELRRLATGMNFRTTAARLAADAGVAPGDLDHWVAEERRVVTAHLGDTLRPHPATLAALQRIAEQVPLAAVSSSALARLAACFTATGLDQLIPADRRFSAEDSLPSPAGKPDPAVYRHACEQLGIPAAAGLAVEDSVTGVRSAVAAGCPTVGNVLFVPAPERAERTSALLDAGALLVVGSWDEIADLVLDETPSRTLLTRGADR